MLFKNIYWDGQSTGSHYSNTDKFRLRFVPVRQFFTTQQEEKIKQIIIDENNKYQTRTLSLKIKTARIDFMNINANYNKTKMLPLSIKADMEVSEIMSGYKRKRMRMKYSGTNGLFPIDLVRELGLIDNNNKPRTLELGEKIYGIDEETNEAIYEYQYD